MLLVAAPIAARAQAPHQHGQGEVKIAFENTRVTIEMEVPGDNILGFEHPATNDAEAATIERAIAALKEPLALLKLSVEAKCAVEEAIVGAEGLKPDAPPGAHADFDVAWILKCGEPDALRTFDFSPLFKRFPRTHDLDVTVVTTRGPSAYEVTQAKPVLDRGNSFWRWLTGR